MKITAFVRTFAVITACLTVGAAAQAAKYNCAQQDITRKVLGIDWADAVTQKNNFLFANRTFYTQNKGFACGHEKIDGCDHNVILLMPATHVFRGDDMNQILFYTCNTHGYNAWQSLGTTSSHVQECANDVWTNTSKRNNHIDAGDRHYFCSSMDNGVCIDKMGGTSEICWMSNERYNCLNKGGKWNKGDTQCSCAKSGYVWDKNTEQCVKDRKTEAQECYDRKGYLDSYGACRCHDNEWFDPNYPNSLVPNRKGLCRPTSQCPKNQGMECPPGQVINVDNSSSFGDVGSNNGNPTVNVGQTQQNQQVTENNNSNENHNGSHNGNTTVIGDNNNVNGGGDSSLQNCLNDPRRAGNQELLACCYVSSSGVNGANPDFTTGKCKCNAAGKTFSVADRKCISGGGNGPVPPVNPHNCPANMYEASDGTCKCNAKWQDPVEERNKVCKCGVPDTHNDANGNCACNDPNKVFDDDAGQCVFQSKQCPAPGMRFDAASGNCKCVNPYQREINNFTGCECTVPGAKNDMNNVCQCTDKDKVVKDGKCEYSDSGLADIRARISASFSSLNSKMGGFEKSVWKNAEGNFNTARLASDSIAGVVLGTAGGIITSKLVKKNQLKKGFEDIKCSIGGQNVASYGDSFTVGM